MLLDKIYLFILILYGSITSPENSVLLSTENPFAGNEVEEQLLMLHPSEGLVYLGAIPFSGTSVEYYADGKVFEKIQYLKGKKHGLNQKWFESEALAYEAYHFENKLHGTSKSWWSNGNIRTESNFELGKSHGLQTEWYSSGVKFKESNLDRGLEEGMQRAWRENGKVYVNYEAKNARIFGLKRSNLCFELENENVIRDEKVSN
jgi:antitoxin component YwqK of YwqJK toxin-antitoxin module